MVLGVFEQRAAAGDAAEPKAALPLRFSRTFVCLLRSCPTRSGQTLARSSFAQAYSPVGRSGRRATRSGTPRALHDGCSARFLLRKLSFRGCGAQPPRRIAKIEKPQPGANRSNASKTFMTRRADPPPIQRAIQARQSATSDEPGTTSHKPKRDISTQRNGIHFETFHTVAILPGIRARSVPASPSVNLEAFWRIR